MRKLLFTLLISSTYLFSQLTNGNIVNTKTPKHINIPGTRVYIIPSENYQMAESFVGLINGNRAAIQIMDLDGDNFYSNAKTFTTENFKKQGIEVNQFLEIKLNEYPAKYVSFEKNNLKSFQLVFGDTTYSTLVMSQFNSLDKESEKDILKMISSIYYDKEKNVNPFDTAQFILDESKSKFKFSKSTSSVFMYSINGEKMENYGNNPFLVVSTFPRELNKSPKDVAVQLVGLLENKGLSNSKVKSINEKNINGKKACEFIIEGKMNEIKSTIYELVVVDTEKTIAIQGIIKSDFEKNISEMKKLTHTLQLK